jgi:hypothetical protein
MKTSSIRWPQRAALLCAFLIAVALSPGSFAQIYEAEFPQVVNALDPDEPVGAEGVLNRDTIATVDLENGIHPVRVLSWQPRVGWVQEAKLTPPEGRDFGVPRALQGDRLILVAGQGRDDPLVQVYKRQHFRHWVLEQTLPLKKGEWTMSVAIFEDHIAVIVGDCCRELPTTLVIFKRDGHGVWRREAHLQRNGPADPAPGFGDSLAIWGDTIAAGAPSELQESGAVYLYSRHSNHSGHDGVWQQDTRLAFDPGTQRIFGTSVALWGNTLVAGAALDGGGNGAAYVFERSAHGVWTQRARLTNIPETSYNCFGGSVAIHGDLIVASTLFDCFSFLDSAPAIYTFFRGRDGRWGHRALIVDPALDTDFASVSTNGVSVSVSDIFHRYILPCVQCVVFGKPHH